MVSSNYGREAFICNTIALGNNHVIHVDMHIKRVDCLYNSKNRSMVWSNLRKHYWAFFDDFDENAVGVTGEQYREMLENFVQPEIAHMAGYWGQKIVQLHIQLEPLCRC